MDFQSFLQAVRILSGFGNFLSSQPFFNSYFWKKFKALMEAFHDHGQQHCPLGADMVKT